MYRFFAAFVIVFSCSSLSPVAVAGSRTAVVASLPVAGDFPSSDEGGVALEPERWETIVRNSAELAASRMLGLSGLDLVRPDPARDGPSFQSFPSSWSRYRILASLDELTCEQVILVELVLDDDGWPQLQLRRMHRGGLDQVLGRVRYPETFDIDTYQELESGIAELVSPLVEVPAQLVVRVIDSSNQALIDGWEAEVVGQAVLDGDAASTLLPPGMHDIVVDGGAGYRAVKRGVALRPGEERSLEVSLDRMGMLAVDAPRRATITVDEQRATGFGDFLVEPGRTLVVDVRLGKRRARRTITLQPGERRSVRIRLPFLALWEDSLFPRRGRSGRTRWISEAR